MFFKIQEEIHMQNNVRPDSMARINTKELADAFIEQQIKEIREQD